MIKAKNKMKSVIQESFEINGSHNKPIGIDLHYHTDLNKQPLAVFAHGYKGFKDYGAWKIIGDRFAKVGIGFARFNFSHNGVTSKTPIDFSDLEAFGQNNFSKEIDDFLTVIKFFQKSTKNLNSIDSDNISIIGHSRGGGMAVLTASESPQVKKLITWAAISNTAMRMPSGKVLEDWKKEGVAFIENARTGQQMPHYYQFYEDFVRNKPRFNIRNAAEKLSIPVCIFHGTRDETVPFENALALEKWIKNGRLIPVTNADHSFGTKHPWESDQLPHDMRLVVDKTIQFIKQ